MRSVATIDTEVIRRAAVPAPGGVPSTAELDDLVGEARIVLIGESSHGTREFYDARARITQWLIAERGFCAVAAEADWPDAYRVNRYVRGLGDEATAEQSLRGFQRFPAWMWRNVVVAEFVDWLRAHNAHAPDRQAGFYGLDLYSLHRSMQEVIDYLDKVDPQAAARARERYACFDHADDDGQAYGRAAAFGAGKRCESEVVEQLMDMQRHALEYARRDGMVAEDEAFYAEQNALTVRNAEMYYRAMFGGRVNTWNLRDRHMAQTLRALQQHLDRRPSPQPARIVVWAHNSHVGDARATEMSAGGQLTLGELARDDYAGDCVLIGFSTHSCTVTAASNWGGMVERKAVRPALPGSVEELFHHAGREFLIRTHIDEDAAHMLAEPRLTRAIGVIYAAATERRSHYFHARAADQFDAIIHIDRTEALEPLERASHWRADEPPESYPTGL